MNPHLEVEGLNQQEKAIFEAIKIYLNKNKVFRLEEIIPYLNHNLDKSLNFNSEKITITLRSLIKKRIIIPGSKFSKEDVLQNIRRNEIYAFIKTHPGSHFTEIKNTFGFGNNYTTWQVKLLEIFQFIRSSHLQNKTIFFDVKSNPKNDELHFYLRNEKVAKIIELLNDNQSALSVLEISKKLKFHQQTVTKYLSVLKRLKIVHSELDGSKKVYKLMFDKYQESLNEIS